MPMLDILKKKNKISEDAAANDNDKVSAPPEFTFMRTTTTTQEIIKPPTFSGDTNEPVSSEKKQPENQPLRHRLSRRFRRSSPAPAPQKQLESSSPKPPEPGKLQRSFSQKLHIKSSSRAAKTKSVYVPSNLPVINDEAFNTKDEREMKWEQRATMLARETPHSRPKTAPGSSSSAAQSNGATLDIRGEKGSRSRRSSISDKAGDENIQEAIRLHENGDLERSTAMFGRLADPEGENNALSQVLYGLALRHGWGCPPDLPRAVTYLSYAASNSAEIEAQALASGMKKGGAAKGELVLAIYELANCFRHGWGVDKDPVAAKQYYETAANLGDTDAMNEVARCYLDGFGTRKDKYTAAKYYRLAEQNGNKTLGNSW
ncbi:HCP-like protein [Xylona heveae TC161]|uniref:HCP-like protein n=1 Tax=Xylona heveae (strain CBS 132557 / TC161) TaxID=1328760 RepID=A0A165HQZ1_XYLHT|nr:HCP-like protein [Xylona heveae TC161]KZF23851.1 HCP-like protein [Xylona heveae TC161]